MITYSGVHIQKIGGEAGTPTPLDIAVQAGRTCRFGGAIWNPLLPHLIFVGLLAYKRSGSISNLIWGFLHDAHEIATADVPTPFKCDCMRREQDAIDERLLDRYFGNRTVADGYIDLPLIKQCDLDACDIEAVELRLPNYEAIRAVHGVGNSGKLQQSLHSDASDIKLFHRVRTAYGGYEVVQGEESAAVRGFSNVLAYAEAADRDGVKHWLESWGTI